MFKMEEVKKYIDDDMLELIFREREEEIYQEKNKENIDVKKIKENNKTNYEQLLKIIKEIPKEFKEIQEKIIEALGKYVARENLIMAYDNEKFYKIGFCDGIRTIIENTTNKKSKEE